MWFSGLAALALATSLTGCGALTDAGQNDQAGSSSNSHNAGDNGQTKGSGGRGVPDRKKQPAGNPDDVKSWLLTEEHLPVDGMKPSEVEVDKEEGDFELSFSLEHPNISAECTDAAPRSTIHRLRPRLLRPVCFEGGPLRAPSMRSR